MSATEALAVEERDYRNDTGESCRMYFSVVVTTAKLFFTSFESSSLKLEDGTLETAKFEQVPYLRVRKQFARTEAPITQEDWIKDRDTDVAREHTVFVVEAVHFVKFLKDLKIDRIAVNQIAV